MIGEPSLILTKIATIRIGNERINNNEKETNKSKSLFIYNYTPHSNFLERLPKPYQYNK